MKTDKVESALVIGGGSGMGKAVSLKLGSMGIKILIADLNQDAIDNTIEEIRVDGGQAEGFEVDYKEGLTGFKWIAKMIKDFPEQEFIGGGEESFGFLTGDFVRDKDAVTATLLACEMAAQKKESGSDLYQYLIDIFNEYGYYKEHLISIVKKGKSGAEEISEMMKNFRENPLNEIAGNKVIKLEDYLSSESKNSETGFIEKIDIPTSNVLIYYTQDGSKIAMRPSGTEPKIKFYISVNTHSKDIFKAEEILQNKINNIISSLDPK